MKEVWVSTPSGEQFIFGLLPDDSNRIEVAVKNGLKEGIHTHTFNVENEMGIVVACIDIEPTRNFRIFELRKLQIDLLSAGLDKLKYFKRDMPSAYDTIRSFMQDMNGV